MTESVKNKHCLHLLVGSSAEAVERCRSRFSDNDAVLFLDDGVMHLAGDSGAVVAPPLPNGVFLAADLQARGLLQLARDAGAEIAGDSDFLELLRKYDFCLTWK